MEVFLTCNLGIFENTLLPLHGPLDLRVDLYFPDASQVIEDASKMIEDALNILERVAQIPDPLPREARPAKLKADCLTFDTRADLDSRKTHWTGIIAALPIADVVKWAIGLGIQKKQRRLLLSQKNKGIACLQPWQSLLQRKEARLNQRIHLVPRPVSEISRIKIEFGPTSSSSKRISTHLTGYPTKQEQFAADYYSLLKISGTPKKSDSEEMLGE